MTKDEEYKKCRDIVTALELSKISTHSISFITSLQALEDRIREEIQINENKNNKFKKALTAIDIEKMS